MGMKETTALFCFIRFRLCRARGKRTKKEMKTNNNFSKNKG